MSTLKIVTAESTTRKIVGLLTQENVSLYVAEAILDEVKRILYEDVPLAPQNS